MVNNFYNLKHNDEEDIEIGKEEKMMRMEECEILLKKLKTLPERRNLFYHPCVLINVMSP